MTNVINYGFGKEYLPNWTIKEALREVFQNYIDYGKYKIKVLSEDNLLVRLEISNNYKPKNLEFLRIGNSNKGSNKEAIGHHGEGLKIAFLIFLKEQLHFTIRYNDYVIFPKWEHNEIIGDTLSIVYKACRVDSNIKFKTILECPKDIYISFIRDIIKEKDIMFTNYRGDIVNRPIGNIYSGNLFVANIPNLSFSYNNKPSNLQLDRDRCVPRDWDITYYCSKINEAFEKFKTNIGSSTNKTIRNYNAKDYTYVEEITDSIANDFRLLSIKGKPEFIVKKDNTVLKNDSVKNALLKHPIFKKDKLKSRLDIIYSKRQKIKGKSVLTLLKRFRDDYCNTEDSIEDINLIIEKYKLDKKKNAKNSNKLP